MPEYLRGQDGVAEVDDAGHLKTMASGETGYLTIEPSAKRFKYRDTRFWGAACYPQSIKRAKEVWRPMNAEEIQSRFKELHSRIPFYQIADTYLRLYPSEHITPAVLVKQIRDDMASGVMSLKNIKIFRPVSRTIGIILNKDLPLSFPASYQMIPLKSGTLVNIKLESRDKLAKGSYKYHDNFEAPYLVYPIEAVAVSAAMWKSEPVSERQRKKIAKAVALVRNAITVEKI